jgi:NtrC-family two-component system response regulator AlgB
MPNRTPTRTNLSLRVLVVDDESNIRTQLAIFLEAEGHQVVAHGTIHEALTEASWQSFDLVFLDVRLGLDNGLDYIPRLLVESPWAKIVVITAYASIETAVTAMKRGATDYLPKPFTPTQVRLVTEKIAQQRMLERRVQAMQQTLDGGDPEADMATNSPAMARAIELASKVAASQATVLIRGEIGTGKGRLAHAIHRWSSRSAAPYMPVHCRTHSAEVLDALIFGVSMKDRDADQGEWPGRLELCEGGTLHLQEIGELSPSLQPKLLRLLNDREFERFNDFKSRRADVRIIATSSIDLAREVRRGHFRPELLLSLEVVTIDLPPLRQRPDDVEPLALRYLAFFCRESRRHISGFTKDAIAVFQKHYWPGNVRELRNVVERAVLICKNDEIGIEHLPSNMLNPPAAVRVGDMVPLETIQDLHIRKVVASTRTIASAANILGVHTGTIMRRLKRFGGDSAAPELTAHDEQLRTNGENDDGAEN